MEPTRLGPLRLRIVTRCAAHSARWADEAYDRLWTMRSSGSSVYLETTIVSYLTAQPSRDVVLAGHQALTRDWWRGRAMYQLRASQLVIDEAGAGTSHLAARRLRALREIALLPLTDSATRLARALIRRGALPEKATVDAFHIGIAAAHGMAYLLTWNWVVGQFEISPA